MKKLTTLLILALVAIAAVWAYADEKMPAKTMEATHTGAMAAIGKAAPDFKLMDPSGTEHSLSEYQGKYVVLEWVNFDCPFVRKFYGSGTMQKLQEEMTKDGVVWLSICSSAPGMQGNFSGEALTDRIKQENLHSTAYLIDADGTVGHMYGAKTTPHMFVINPKGELVYAGAMDNKPSTKPEDIEGATNYVRATFASLKSGKAIEKSATEPYGCSVKYKQ